MSPDGRREVVLGTGIDVAGVVELDGSGTPIAFRQPCRNRACCPRREGMVSIHRWSLDAETIANLHGDKHRRFQKRYEPRIRAADLAAAADRG